MPKGTATHEYTLGKGYPEDMKGTVIVWSKPRTLAEAIPEYFKDEATLLHKAVANLNVDKGHAIQEAVLAALKGDPEKGIAPRKLTVAEMREVAESTNADSDIRKRGTGGVKAQAQKLTDVQKRASERWATANAEQRALMVDLGLYNADGTPTTPAAVKTEAKPKSTAKAPTESGKQSGRTPATAGKR